MGFAKGGCDVRSVREKFEVVLDFSPDKDPVRYEFNMRVCPSCHTKLCKERTTSTEIKEARAPLSSLPVNGQTPKRSRIGALTSSSSTSGRSTAKTPAPDKPELQ